MLTKIFLILLLARSYQAQQRYVPPAALVEPLSPIGIRISIPDEAGIQLVAYHVKINDEMVGLEAGTIARDIPSAKRGRWTYHDRTTQLKKGDTIYYWVHVIYRGLGYNLVDQEHVVTDFYDYNGNKIQSAHDSCNIMSSAQSFRVRAYVPPAPLIHPLSPIGIQISIPDKAGIRLVAFHVKINDAFVGLESGTITRDIVKLTDGHWVYQDKSTKLQKGDTIYYWVHVIYNKLGYSLIDRKYIVEDFYDYNGNKIQSCNDKCNYITSIGRRTVDNNCHTQCYVPPVPLIEPLTPVGIRMSIPDEEGISLVAFHVKFNDEFVGLEAGTIARDIVKAKNGRWTYFDTTTKLKKGDTIYYWIYVIYKGLGYNLIEQEYRVTDFFDKEGKNTIELNNRFNAIQSCDENDTTQSTFENTTTESSVKKETRTKSCNDITTTKLSVEKTTTQSSKKKTSTESSDTAKTSTSHGKT